MPVPAQKVKQNRVQQHRMCRELLLLFASALLALCLDPVMADKQTKPAGILLSSLSGRPLHVNLDPSAMLTPATVDLDASLRSSNNGQPRVRQYIVHTAHPAQPNIRDLLKNISQNGFVAYVPQVCAHICMSSG